MYIQGLTSETENFAYKVKFIVGLKSTCPDDLVAKTGVDGPMTELKSGKHFRIKT